MSLSEARDLMHIHNDGLALGEDLASDVVLFGDQDGRGGSVWGRLHVQRGAVPVFVTADARGRIICDLAARVGATGPGLATVAPRCVGAHDPKARRTDTVQIRNNYSEPLSRSGWSV